MTTEAATATPTEGSFIYFLKAGKTTGPAGPPSLEGRARTVARGENFQHFLSPRRRELRRRVRPK